ncbi:hypothetical protein ACH4ZU_12145 [Streptomyces sp. NPDC020472]|uniref:hypothetical protein n=1 Tax=Streptomyces sp. NPDC020472 TaxID=3365075 RepID=UPI0037A4064E
MKLLRAIVAGFAAAVFLIFADQVGAYHLPKAAEPKRAHVLTFRERMKAEGRVFWGVIDGHRDCWAQIGDTSYVTCRDGYKTTS